MKRSSFDLTHERKLTAKADGTLYPIFCEAVLPGDKFRITSEILARMTPLINPVYHRFDLFTHFFFVPNRLIWKDFEKFLFPEQNRSVDGREDIELPHYYVNYELPEAFEDRIPVASVAPGTLADHLGCSMELAGSPIGEANIPFNILPFRAYNLIWNEWYRDQDLQPTEGINLDTVDMELEESIFSLKQRAWAKDYFTSARPWPQKGDASIVVTSVNQQDFGFIDPENAGGGNWVPEQTVYESDGAGNIVPDGSLGGLFVDKDGQTLQIPDVPGSGVVPAILDTQAAFSIEQLREASAIQRFLEKLGRSGSRFNEAIRSFFGVKVKDYRVQRPELIGGGRQPVVISEVLQTSATVTTPLGTQAGHGISQGNSRSSFFVPEHGYIIGLMSIMPRAGYVHALRRDAFKLDRYDFFFPEFAGLGDQPIYQVELNGVMYDENVDVFGYQQRYAEYKFIPSTVHGQFKTDGVLKNWVADRDSRFYELNEDFIRVTPEDNCDRIYAISSEAYDPFLVSVLNRVHAIRPVPVHPVAAHVI